MKQLTILSAIFCILLGSCSHHSVPKWLIGDWVFDSAATLEQAKSGQSNNSIEDGLASALQGMVVPMLAGMELNISKKEMIVSFNGGRKLSEISVFENEGDVCTLKQTDGTLIEYHKTIDGFWRLSDEGPLKMYFKRK